MLAKVQQARAIRQAVDHEFLGGPGHQYLTAVRCREQARAAVERSAYVMTGSELGVSCVEGDAYPHLNSCRPPLVLESPLHIKRAVNRVAWVTEDCRHAIPLTTGLDEPTMVPRDELIDDPVVKLKRLTGGLR